MCRISAGANWFLALLALTNFKPAVSSIYPTKPVAATTFPTGQLATVTWRDDGHEPHLKDIGLMRIDLHNDIHESNNTYVTTLAKDVDPMMRSHTLFIPPDLPTDYYYHMRFISSKPPLTIYTADFKFTESIFLPAESKPEDDSSHPTDFTSTPTSNPSSTPQLVSATTIYADPLDGGTNPKDSAAHNAGSGTKKSSGKRVDPPGVFFKLAFVLWPAVVGVSLAI